MNKTAPKSIKAPVRPLFESTVNSAAKILFESLTKMSEAKKVSMKFCEETSWFLNRAYSNHGRIFHGIRHAQNVSISSNGSPTAQLAGLFHDAVYLQLDGDSLDELKNLILPFELRGSNAVYIPKGIKDDWAQALRIIFDFPEDQVIKLGTGLNEFLSAWATVKKLKDQIIPLDLLSIVINIYSTVPLWVLKGAEEGFSSFLSKRIEKTLKHLNLNPPPEYIDRAIWESVEVANQDTINFSENDLKLFLSNTWSLLCEINPTLTKKYFTTFNYRNALIGMESFISSLDYKHVFRSYKNKPSSVKMDELEELARKNINLSGHYLKLRVLEANFLSALADLSGGDGPLEMFVGPKPDRRFGEVLSVEPFLNLQTPGGIASKLVPGELAALLQGESPFRSSFDGKNAVVASYLFRNMSLSEIQKSFEAGLQYAKGQIKAVDYLNGFRPELVLAILKATIAVSFTRADELTKFLNQFEADLQHR